MNFYVDQIVLQSYNRRKKALKKYAAVIKISDLISYFQARKLAYKSKRFFYKIPRKNKKNWVLENIFVNIDKSV
jgi:hypothetical protein